MPDADAYEDPVLDGLIAVRLQEQCRRRMSRFFEACVLVKTLPAAGTAEHGAALERLAVLQQENESPMPRNKPTK